MTVEVETLDGLRRGSSVYQVMARNKAALAPTGQARDWRVTGEAVAVDLPGGQTLFALLRTSAIHNDLAGMSMSALDPLFRNDMVESAARIAAREGIRSPANVRASDYPMLVAFGSTTKPETVQEVVPSNLADSFGSNVRLAAIRVEITDDAVKSGLKRRLPWLTAGSRYVSTGPRLIPDPDPYDHSAIATLAFGDFLSDEA